MNQQSLLEKGGQQSTGAVLYNTDIFREKLTMALYSGNKSERNVRK